MKAVTTRIPLIFLIFLVALIVRVWRLDYLPVGFTPDEASFGYDAYSLITTGKDQWGNQWPLVLKSFGDGKLPLYAYLAIPAVFLFGLSEYSVRLPAALLGAMAIIYCYLLTKKLLKHEKNKLGRLTPYIAATLLALSPWHLPLSRGAFEANLTSFFLTAGIFYLLVGFRKKPFLLISAIFLGLNLFSYHSARIITIPAILFVIFSNKKNLRISSWFFASSLVLLLFATLAAITMFFGGGSRIQSSTIFTSVGNFGIERYYAITSGANPIVALLFENRIVEIVGKFFENLVNYFSINFFLTEGAREGTYGMLPGMGLMNIVEFLGLLIGVALIIRSKKEYVWLLLVIFISLVPATISLGPGGAANRAASAMPFVQIVSALGIVHIVTSLHAKVQNLASFSIFLIYISFTLHFLFTYIYIQPKMTGVDMFFGIDKVVDQSSKAGKNIIVSREISEAHIFYAFYNRVHPKKYQEFSSTWDLDSHKVLWVDQLPSWQLENATFTSIDWVRDIQKDAVLVIRKTEVPQEVYQKNKEKIVCWLCE